MQRVVAGEAFDGRDRPISTRLGQRQARMRRPALDEDRTCAALTTAADQFRTGERETLAQRHEQRLVRRGGDVVRGSVDDETHVTILARTTSNRRIP